MTQTPTNPELDYRGTLNEIAAHLFGLGEDCAKNGIMNGVAYDDYVNQLEATIKKEALKARLDELNKIYGATSYREIVDRRADLKKQLGSK